MVLIFGDIYYDTSVFFILYYIGDMGEILIVTGFECNYIPSMILFLRLVLGIFI